MADGGTDPSEPVVSFDILSGFKLDDTEIDLSKLSEEQQDALQNLMDTLNVNDNEEIRQEKDAFEEKQTNFHHASCSAEQVDNITGNSIKDTTKWQTKWAVNVYKDWLRETNRDPDFENLPDEILAGHLRQFFAEVRKKNNENYSKSGMINLRAGLNRYLQNPPNNRIINLMRNDVFQNANKVFKGKLRMNKAEGLDTSKPKSAILQQDLDKLYNSYFREGLSNSNSEILQEKVFFDLIYHTGRRGKEGLRALMKDSFTLKETPDGKEYIELAFNPVTKKNQGDESSSSYSFYNEKPIILQQDDSFLCPVNSFKHYMNRLHDNLNDFWQRPNKARTGYDSAPLGKNTLGTLMKEISRKAQLSRIYTNHEIRSTTATAMHKSKFNLKEIQNVTKHKNIQSLERYVSGPTLEEKEKYSTALYKYATSEKRKRQDDEVTSEDPEIEDPTKKVRKILQKYNAENLDPVPLQPQQPALLPEGQEKAMVPQDQSPEVLGPNFVQNNQQQVKQAPVMFAGATFNNCQITLNVPK